MYGAEEVPQKYQQNVLSALCEHCSAAATINVRVSYHGLLRAGLRYLIVHGRSLITVSCSSIAVACGAMAAIARYG